MGCWTTQTVIPRLHDSVLSWDFLRGKQQKNGNNEAKPQEYTNLESDTCQCLQHLPIFARLEKEKRRRQ
mgnify:CR=1 FL=1